MPSINIPRKRGVNALGENFDQATIQAVWEKGTVVVEEDGHQYPGIIAGPG